MPPLKGHRTRLQSQLVNRQKPIRHHVGRIATRIQIEVAVKFGLDFGHAKSRVISKT